MNTRGNVIQIIEKPEWVSWDEIHKVIWKAHATNREKGMNMAFPSLPGEKIKEKIEGNGKMYVALNGKKVVGTAAIKIKNANLWCGRGDYAHCCFASVLPEYNGEGIYKMLSEKREEQARNMGLVCMMFDTHEDNSKVIGINKKNGYMPVDISVMKDHYNVVMVRWLNGCPYSDWYIKWQFMIRKCYKKLRYKPGRIKRFGI